jgi:hypothetical protein
MSVREAETRVPILESHKLSEFKPAALSIEKDIDKTISSKESMGLELTRSGNQFFVSPSDDRPLPALEKLRLQIHQKEIGFDMATETDDEPEPLTDSQWNDLVDIINAFGEPVTRCLVSKQFTHKESAIRQIMERLDHDDIKDVSKAGLIPKD